MFNKLLINEYEWCEPKSDTFSFIRKKIIGEINARKSPVKKYTFLNKNYITLSAVK